ncbi:MAG: hypothetical protein H7223_08570 [Pedobacter sp.]|nr:hypothetical protein [Pedobacter sp.]
MEFDKPELQQEHGSYAIVRTSNESETRFLVRAALATSDKDFYDQVQATTSAEDGTASAMRAFVELAMTNVEQNSLLRNLAFGVSKRRAGEIKAQISQ